MRQSVALPTGRHLRGKATVRRIINKIIDKIVQAGSRVAVDELTCVEQAEGVR